VISYGNVINKKVVNLFELYNLGIMFVFIQSGSKALVPLQMKVTEGVGISSHL